MDRTTRIELNRIRKHDRPAVAVGAGGDEASTAASPARGADGT